ncbi:histidine kinase dimerization/phospho-acceptor domain-containing protein [Pedobacter duraquae]|uniref:histidine kinase n=1 Tax=Pedobacter duraquae TaxID=425511 RepID=A0A4R6ILX6_9SPHI|nr:histidine kinase dimerization/phospho-acceptor domain-containing protein [Pedobacter duraquae]TDO23107.1 PAS domain-containing protein [Pedobacter duraquae]
MKNFEETKKLLDNSQIYYMISVGMDSTYTYANKRYNRVFENQYGNLVGQHYSITMHKDDMRVCESVSGLAFRFPDRIFPATIRKHDGKGGYITTQWDYKAMFDENGQPAGVFCIGYDITEFMQQSNELEETKESLSKTQFTLAEIAYMQSHGVRKPIANIMGLSMLLETMEMDESLKNMVDMISASAKELDQLIKNMANLTINK